MKPSDKNNMNSAGISRRRFVQNSTLASIAMLCNPILSFRSYSVPSQRSGAATRTIFLDQNWLFYGKYLPSFPDKQNTVQITLPHCVTKLSWQNWDPESWENLWFYRRHFVLPKELHGLRMFLHFDGVMVSATPTINGYSLPQHLGGYLPFQYEITKFLQPIDNVLDVVVDSRWNNVPPEGSPKGAKRIDYLEPGGICRSVCLRAVPQIFISNVFAKPVNVLDPNRKIEVSCSIDAAIVPSNPVLIVVEMKQGDRVVSLSRQTVSIEKTGLVTASLNLSDFKDNITFWHVDNPNLYDIVTTLFIEGKPLHDHHIRIGIRDARFETDGFFLNGQRLQLFGLNRHEIFPYVGFAMPERVMRHDAKIIRHEFNCNIVRCSHYPQTEAFLNACDEMGLMVWEEVPGWGYLGDESWKSMLVKNVEDMVVRDRNHASIIIWGVRVNESPNDPVLYRKTKEVANLLDGSRPTSGSMTPDSIKTWKEDWHQDVLAFDDYHSDTNGSVGIREPEKGVPYMLAEAVGQFNYSKGKEFDSFYRRAGDIIPQQQQALWHAQAHSKAAANKRNCGVIAWCAFEYYSLLNDYKGIKYPGIADVFRIPKLGASFYQAQCDPKSKVVIQPNFYWDFGPKSPHGPGKNVAIFANCDRLELFINDRPYGTLHPDSINYPNLEYPPFFTDLELDGTDDPELRIDGFIGETLALSRSFSSDPVQDQFLIVADDDVLAGDGSDATRIVFRIVDKFGAPRPFAGGEVILNIEGPGIIIGDNPFSLKESGGAGAIWIKTMPNRSGTIFLKATHSLLKSKNIKILVHS